MSEGAARALDLVALVTGGTAALATIAINDCFHSKAEVALPEPGTTRAGWCGVLTGDSVRLAG